MFHTSRRAAVRGLVNMVATALAFSTVLLIAFGGFISATTTIIRW